AGGQSSRIREITIENVMGSTMKIALWGSAANQVRNDPIDCDSTPWPVLVDVCSTFVKNYHGKVTLSSTNVTKVYNNVDICPYARPPLHIMVPTRKGKTTIHIFDSDNRKTISQLLTAKWDPSFQAANVIMCNATATNVMIESGWHYLACPRCSKKVLSDNGDLWCNKSKAKVDMPIARYMLRFEVEYHTGTTVFVALDSEIQNLVCLTVAELIGTSEDNAKETIMSGFSQILHKVVDF
ncbi:hypothetical protein MKW98_013977, partial [Papaver atlanticum]